MFLSCRDGRCRRYWISNVMGLRNYCELAQLPLSFCYYSTKMRGGKTSYIYTLSYHSEATGHHALPITIDCVSLNCEPKSICPPLICFRQISFNSDTQKGNKYNHIGEDTMHQVHHVCLGCSLCWCKGGCTTAIRCKKQNKTKNPWS